MFTQQWIQALLRRLRPGLADRQAANSVRLQLLLELRRLRPQRYNSYVGQLAQSVTLSVSYRYIDEYTMALREAFSIVKDGRTLDPASLSTETFRVSLDRFMTSSDGYYVDPVAAIARFKTVATLLCEAMEAADYAEYGPAEHNLRMLRPTLLNALELTRGLLAVSAT